MYRLKSCTVTDAASITVFTVAVALSPAFNWCLRGLRWLVYFSLHNTRTFMLTWEELFSLIKFGQNLSPQLPKKLPCRRRLQMSSFIWYYLAGRLHWAARWRDGQGRGSPARWRTSGSLYTKREHHHDHPVLYSHQPLPLKGQCHEIFCFWFQRHRWCTLSCEYLREFSNKFETAIMVYSGAWGKLIHEKTRGRKFRDTVQFKSIHEKETPVTPPWSLCPWHSYQSFTLLVTVTVAHWWFILLLTITHPWPFHDQ